MFFTFSKILILFLYPLPLFFIFMIYVFFKTSGGRNKFRILLATSFLWAASSFPVCQYLIRSLEKEYPPVKIEDLPKKKVVVVLGGMVNTLTYHEGRMELLSSADRLTDSILIYKKGKAEKILFTGGSGILFYDKTREADFVKEFLIHFGISEKDIILERESRNTLENALYTSKILREKNIDEVILVTSAFHMKRSVEIFQAFGIKVVPFPTDYRALKEDFSWDTLIPSIGALETTTIVLKEWVGLIAYRMKTSS